MNTFNQTISCCTQLYQLPLTQLLLGDSFHPGGLTLTKKLAQKTLINRQSLVLDVAAGKGTSAKYLSAHYGAQVFALDLGLENLQDLLPSSSGRNKNLMPIVGDALSLPFVDNALDVVLCECTLCTFSNKSSALKEMYRVLRPGGFIAISDIYLNQPLPQSLTQDVSRWLCVADSCSALQSQECISATGFNKIQFNDESQHLITTIKTIEQKITKMGHLPIIKTQLDKLTDFPFKQLSQFIIDGNAGYYLLTARKQ
ncbi:class I SAM-dependent methyltransferase [Candidatus Colwellia aromaticivorans]|uniref:class I SAM-dependent methyltransferase n=1 Tax=Candidatus Colwellia aromaticivorans TaxID=2267621 RepID=UPI000DF362DC|nr:class I SAM-dependent methyltransferase [Candidatus Colwellia aromaticivorans]